MSNWEVHREVFIRRWAKNFLNIQPWEIEGTNWGFFYMSPEIFPDLDLSQTVYIDDIELQVNNIDMDSFDFKSSYVTIETVYTTEENKVKVLVSDPNINFWLVVYGL